jgi:hypothetical protein
MDKERQSREDKYGVGGIFIPGGLLFGMGVGFLINNIAAGIFLGLGIGFILFGISAVMHERKGNQ